MNSFLNSPAKTSLTFVKPFECKPLLLIPSKISSASKVFLSFMFLSTYSPGNTDPYSKAFKIVMN